MRAAFVIAALALGTAPVAAAEAGKTLFNDNCSGCHQLGGIGSPGLAPPLVDPALWSGLGDEAPAYIASVLAGGLSGTITANGETYRGLAMPSHSWMTDEEMSEVANYVLGDLNGLDRKFTPEDAATARLDARSHRDLIAQRKAALQ